MQATITRPAPSEPAVRSRGSVRLAGVVATLCLALAVLFGVGLVYGRLSPPSGQNLRGGATSSVGSPSNGFNAGQQDQADHGSGGGFGGGGGGGHGGGG